MGKKLLFSIVFVVILLAGGGYIGDRTLRARLNMSLFQAVNLLVQTTSPPEFGNIEEANISEENMSALMKEKEELESALMQVNVSRLNENENLTLLLGELFGKNYTIHFYTFFEQGGKSYKLLKWEIRLENGTITSFKPGEPENPDLNVGVSQDILSELSGADQETVRGWLEEGKIKVYPLPELLRLTNFFPRLFELLRENEKTFVG